MKLKALFVPAALLLAAPLAAQKVYVDWDRDAAVNSYETYAWLETPATSVADTDPLMDDRIRNEIEMQMSHGLRRVESDPDLYVTYHTDEKEEMRLNTSTFGYGYGGGWGWDPYWGTGWGSGASTTTVQNYTRGTLIIDLYDARTKKVVWRGTAEAVIPSSPRKGEKLISKAINKIAKKWEKQSAKAGLK